MWDCGKVRGVSNPGLQLYLTTCTLFSCSANHIIHHHCPIAALHQLQRTGSGVSVPLFSGSAFCPLGFLSVFCLFSPCQYQYRQYDHHRSSRNTSYVMTSPLVWPSSSLLLVSGITRIAATAWSLETAQLWQTGRCPLLSVLIWPGPGHDKIWRHPGHLGIVYSLHVHRGHWALQGQWVQTKVSCSRRGTEGNQKLLSR